jgi:hypothetical protein
MQEFEKKDNLDIFFMILIPRGYACQKIYFYNNKFVLAKINLFLAGNVATKHHNHKWQLVILVSQMNYYSKLRLIIIIERHQTSTSYG